MVGARRHRSVALPADPCLCRRLSLSFMPAATNRNDALLTLQ
jgi:hypothetical protein